MIGDDLAIEVVDATPSRGSMLVKLGLSAPTCPLDIMSKITTPIYSGERLYFGKDIFVEVVDAYPYRNRIQIRLGIEAPRTVTVHRQEIWDKVKNGEANEATQPSSAK